MMRNSTKDKIATIFAALFNEIQAVQEMTGLNREEVLAQYPVLAGKVLMATEFQKSIMEEYN